MNKLSVALIAILAVIAANAAPAADRVVLRALTYLLTRGDSSSESHQIDLRALQRNFGVASYCSATDARNFARTDGLCDSGAYEQTVN